MGFGSVLSRYSLVFRKIRILRGAEMLVQYLTIGTLIFFLLNIVNVMLSTVKTVYTVKASKIMATLINAIYYGYYTIIIKQIGTLDIEMIVVVTILANLIGVYFSLWLLDRFKKDKVWKISIICCWLDSKAIAQELIENDIGYNNYDVYTKYGTSVGMDIFSKSQKDSKIIKNIISDYAVKYNITELSKSL